MIISGNASQLSFFLTTLDTRFWEAFKVAESWTDRICTTYPVEGEQWVSAWIGMLDTYREWLGPRRTHQPAPQTYLVPIKNWELTEELDEFRLADSSAATAMSYYAPTVAFMGLQAKKLHDYKVRDLIQNQGAFTGPWQNGTDGLTNWNGAHPVDFYDSSKGTYPNDYRGGVTGFGGVSCGGAFSAAAFNTIWSDVSLRRSESGEALGVMADLTMVPSQLRAAAATIIQNQAFAGSAIGQITGNVGAIDNPFHGWTDLMCNVDLTNANDFYMLTTKAPIKPLSILQRLAPDFIPRNTPNDPVSFNMHKILYGSKARFSIGWGLPWLSSISGPTASA